MQLLREFVGLRTAEEIRSTRGAYEQRIAGENSERSGWRTRFRDLVGQMFGRVARRVARGQHDGSERESITVAHRFMRKLVVGILGTRENPGTAGAVGEFARAADKVCVDVGLEHVRDRQPMPTGAVDVDVDVRPRVDHCGRPGLGITEQVGQLRDAVGFDRLDDERH